MADRAGLVKRTAIALAVSVGAIGALHLPVARGLLARVGGCPVATAKMTPVEMENARHIAAASERGTAQAPSRPALAFMLDVTTAAQVQAWADAHRVTCDAVHPGLLKCTDVPAGAVGAAAPAIDELALGFDVSGRLVNLTTMRQHLSPAAAATAASSIATSLRAELGKSTSASGEFDAAHLAQRGALSTATVGYRFADYVADVSAMNLGPSGTSVREHYMSARD
jgi:hypothetical protein